MTGRVIVGGDSYPNSWLPKGKTIRQVICGKCLDTGREVTDDGSLGEICDCTYGDALNEQAIDCGFLSLPWELQEALLADASKEGAS